MRALISLIIALLLASSCFSQAGKVGFAVDISNNLMRRFKNSRFITLSTANLGVDVKIRNSNLRLYGSYGYSNIKPVSSTFNVAIKSHFVGGGFEAYFSIKSKIIKPYFSVNVLNEINTNYPNGYIYNFHPVQYEGIPIAESIYQGHGNPSKIIYGGWFYQSTPLLANVNTGASFRIVKNLRLNLSIGYNLKVMNYKYVQWTKYDDRDEMIRKTPMQRKALHSIAGQIGLNYVFSFQKKQKNEIP